MLDAFSAFLLPDLMDNPTFSATKEAETVCEVEDPQAGSMRFLGSPAEFAETPMTMRSFPPRHGEDTDEVVKEVGYDDAAIAELRESGAVA